MRPETRRTGQPHRSSVAPDLAYLAASRARTTSIHRERQPGERPPKSGHSNSPFVVVEACHMSAMIDPSWSGSRTRSASPVLISSRPSQLRSLIPDWRQSALWFDLSLAGEMSMAIASTSFESADESPLPYGCLEGKWPVQPEAPRPPSTRSASIWHGLDPPRPNHGWRRRGG